MEKDLKKPSFAVSLSSVAFLFIIIIAQLIAVGSPDIHLTLVFATAFTVLMLMLSLIHI